MFLIENEFEFEIDIRVYHRYLFVQYETVKQANELIEQGQQQSLSIKGHRLGKFH